MSNMTRNISASTRMRYWNVIKNISRLVGRPPSQLTFADCVLFVESRSGSYSPGSLSFYRSAINKFLSSRGIEERISITLPQSGKRKKSRGPGRPRQPARVMSRDEVRLLLDSLSPFYRDIAEKIYNGPVPPVVVLASTPSALAATGRSGNVSYRTLSVRLRRITKDWDNGTAGPGALFVSGILHALEDGHHWRDVQSACGRADSTMAKYVKLAEKSRRDIKSPLDD